MNIDSYVENSFNVIDELKSLSKEEIQNYYSTRTNNAAVAMTHISGDYNLSTVIRSANFHGFKEVFYIGGKRQWDKRGAVGTYNYIKITYCKTAQEFFELIDSKYVPIALENNINFGKPINNIYKYNWPVNPIIICGEEQLGIPNEILEKCVDLIEIPHRGTVRSMNVGTAAGIAMSLYTQSQFY